MNKAYTIFSILAVSVLISVPFMHAYSQVTMLKVNELEMNPPGPIAGNQWIEIYNPTDVLIDLSGFLIKSTQLQRTHQVSQGIVVEPNGYVIIRFHDRFFNENGDAALLLTRDSVEIDRTPIFSDMENDDRTWQRFPNAIDTGDISDWAFRNATFGISNGFPAQRPNFTLSDPIPIDQDGNRVGSFVQGQMVGVRSEIVNLFDDERSFAYIIQVKDGDGYPLFIGWVEDLIILPNKMLKPSIFFNAESSGEYTVDVFVWRSMAIAEPLTPPKHGIIRIAG